MNTNLKLSPNQRELLSMFLHCRVMATIVGQKEPTKHYINFNGRDLDLVFRYVSCNLGWAEEKIRRTFRGLYGVVSLDDIHLMPPKRKIMDYYIPNNILPALNEALKHNEDLQLSFEEEDLAVLQRLYERRQELLREYGSGWNPTFHQTNVANLLGKEKSEVRKSLDRLVGLLGVVCTWESGTRDPRNGEDKRYKVVFNFGIPRWFLPRARIEDIKRTLAEYTAGQYSSLFRE